MVTKKTTASAKTTKKILPEMTETFRVKGENLISKIKELIKEGNIRQITIKNKENKTLIVLPLTLGVLGVALAPVLAAIGAIAALVTECTITVERK